ncbi:hypothetical protein AX16_010975 [Volvariella volvacea WC 439]|nr:hypothetical protein AX16_010975 [Volvariella volvacea WC 439]
MMPQSSSRAISSGSGTTCNPQGLSPELDAILKSMNAQILQVKEDARELRAEISQANDRLAEAERRMEQALERAHTADQERMEAVEAKAHAEAALTVSQGRLEQQTQRAQEAEERVRERDATIEELNAEINRLRDRTTAYGDGVHKGAGWWLELGAGIMLFIGGPGFFCTMAVTVPYGGGISIIIGGSGLVCMLDALLTPSTKRFIRRVIKWIIGGISVTHCLEILTSILRGGRVDVCQPETYMLRSL